MTRDQISGILCGRTRAEVDPITAVAPAAGALDNFPRRLAFIPLAVGVVLLMIAMYRNRGNFAKVSMSEFYAWSSELRAGGNPWQASGDPAFKPLPGALHLGHCNYPPAFLMAFEPLTMLPVRAAYWLWQGIILVCLLAATAGYLPAVLFHDYGGTLLLVGWLFSFWFIAFRWLLPNDASLSPLALSTS